MADGAATQAPGLPTEQVAAQVSRIAAMQGIQVGYAGYWDASSIAWATDLKVQVYPLYVCPNTAFLCQYYLHYITSW